METFVFLFSFSALGILYAMNSIPAFQEPYVILEIGVAVLVVVFLFYFLITRGNPPKDVLFFVFAVFSFTCVIDLVSALEYDGFISGFMTFYQKTGEPYLGTPYAIMMCYWDGIVHFIMYLVMISRITDRKGYRSLGLIWAGSLCANMSVFIAGIVAGKYGSEIRPAFWINFLFLLMPVWGAITLFTRPKDRPLIGGYNSLDELDDDDAVEKNRKEEEELVQANTFQNEAMAADPATGHLMETSRSGSGRHKSSPGPGSEEEAGGNSRQRHNRHTRDETLVKRMEELEAELVRERQENERLLKAHEDKDDLIGKLKEEIDLLNRDLDDIEDENEQLKEENKTLLKVVGQLTR
ncbi:transmembrane 6 superfamily member 1-like [Notothenia coriiceps]|uniref:Transmembrane 6 superfamily member 1-like n=1 Tax=Notothenia coriiceps TaxID=8208 RepID=A0A6I9NH27_9TELE|nr:PREDICTED: transmembrane 6 superfamily member 1-like [Notothenia coriiceps]